LDDDVKVIHGNWLREHLPQVRSFTAISEKSGLRLRITSTVLSSKGIRSLSFQIGQLLAGENDVDSAHFPKDKIDAVNTKKMRVARRLYDVLQLGYLIADGNGNEVQC
jgi:hypothetical protein